MTSFKGWEECRASEVEVGDVVTFSQFFNHSHNSFMRTVLSIPAMLMVNGEVSGVTSGPLGEGVTIWVRIWSMCIMHPSGMKEEYSFGEADEFSEQKDLPAYDFHFLLDDALARSIKSDGA